MPGECLSGFCADSMLQRVLLRQLRDVATRLARSALARPSQSGMPGANPACGRRTLRRQARGLPDPLQRRFGMCTRAVLRHERHLPTDEGPRHGVQPGHELQGAWLPRVRERLLRRRRLLRHRLHRHLPGLRGRAEAESWLRRRYLWADQGRNRPAKRMRALECPLRSRRTMQRDGRVPLRRSSRDIVWSTRVVHQRDGDECRRLRWERLMPRREEELLRGVRLRRDGVQDRLRQEQRLRSREHVRREHGRLHRGALRRRFVWGVRL